jgi:hypothetical protein
MPKKMSKQRLSIAFAAGALVAAMVPGLASAAPGECKGDNMGQIVKFVIGVNGTPIGGPNGDWGWAHPDGHQATPGQAFQYFCNEH